MFMTCPIMSVCKFFFFQELDLIFVIMNDFNLT